MLLTKLLLIYLVTISTTHTVGSAILGVGYRFSLKSRGHELDEDDGVFSERFGRVQDTSPCEAGLSSSLRWSFL